MKKVKKTKAKDMKQLLLLSSSREGQTGYLEHALSHIERFLSNKVTEILFIPYAGVSFSYAEYTQMVATALAPLNIKVTNIASTEDPKLAVEQAQAIVVGGGNTFHLLHQLYHYDLVELIRERVEMGTPYIGWSAGSNIAGLTIRTTNDMPIIEPPSFNALALVPFQLNPHYTDYQPEAHNGETRAQRLREFTCIDKTTPIIGIQEGSALKLTNNKLSLIGDKEAYLFVGDIQKQVLSANADLTSFI